MALLDGLGKVFAILLPLLGLSLLFAYASFVSLAEATASYEGAERAESRLSEAVSTLDDDRSALETELASIEQELSVLSEFLEASYEYLELHDSFCYKEPTGSPEVWHLDAMRNCYENAVRAHEEGSVWEVVSTRSYAPFSENNVSYVFRYTGSEPVPVSSVRVLRNGVEAGRCEERHANAIQPGYVCATTLDSICGSGETLGVEVAGDVVMTHTCR